MDSKPSAFENAGRRRKVLKLVAVIDPALAANGIGPFSEAAVDFVANFSEQNWSSAIAAAKVNEPSPETRAELVAFYRERAENEKAARARAVSDYEADRYKAQRDERVGRKMARAMKGAR